MRHSEPNFQGFCPLPWLSLYYNSATTLPELVRPLFLLLDNFLCYPCNLSIEYFDPHRFLVSTMGVIVSLVFFIFFHVLKLTDSLLLLLYVCAIVSFWFGPLLWKLAPFFVFSHQKFKTLVHPSTEKVIWNTLYVAQQKWTCHIYLEAHKSQEIS